MSKIKKQNRVLIARILGNDVPGLHGTTQTIENLKFTIQYEMKYPQFEYVYFLNRMYDKSKKTKIIDILNKNNIKVIDIPFEISVYNTLLKKCPDLLSEKLTNRYILRAFKKILKEFNFYIANNNGARNTVLEYGKWMGFDWTFVLDSNSFIDDKLYKSIIKVLHNTKISTKFMVIPQVRLQDGNMKNDSVINNDWRINALPIREPQLAFHISTNDIFEEKLPYGCAPKAEFLSRLGVPGPWNGWASAECRLNQVTRKPKINEKWVTIERIIRLSPFEKNNCLSSNARLRTVGILLHVRKIFKLYNLKM